MSLSIQSNSQKLPIDSVKVADGEIKRINTCQYEGCKKKVSLVQQAILCRCDKVFCPKHRDVVAHGCIVKVEQKEGVRKAKHLYESSLRSRGFY